MWVAYSVSTSSFHSPLVQTLWRCLPRREFLIFLLTLISYLLLNLAQVSMCRWLSGVCHLKITPATGPPRPFCHCIVDFMYCKKKVLSRTFFKKETFVIDLALIPTPAPLVTFELNVLSSKKDVIEPNACVWRLLGQIPARCADNKRWKKSLLCRCASAQTKGVLFRSLCGRLLIPVGKLSGLLPPPLWGSEVRVSHSAGGALQLFKGFGCKSSWTLAVQTFARFKGNIYVYFLGSVHHRSQK